MKKTYDQQCYDLAEAFLEEYEIGEDIKDELAQLIQETIEDFIAFDLNVEK